MLSQRGDKDMMGGHDHAGLRTARRWLKNVGGAFAVALLVVVLLPTGVKAASSTKVALIVLENHDYNNIVGNSSAPYLNSLMSEGLFLSDYNAIVAGSDKDYRAMTSGTTNETTPTSANIFQGMQAAGDSWTELNESMGGNCGVTTSKTVPGTSVPLYVTDHDPAWMYASNEDCDADDVPLTSDSQLASLPKFSFIVPNDCDDMHTFPPKGTCPAYFGSVKASDAVGIGDAWLSHVVPRLLADPSVTVIVTFDEGNSPNEHIYAVELGAGVTAGTVDTTKYNHYGLLAGLYENFALGTAPHNGAKAKVVSIG
jgi:hypothetical protein